MSNHSQPETSPIESRDGKRHERYGQYKMSKDVESLTVDSDDTHIDQTEHEAISKEAMTTLNKTSIRICIKGGDNHRSFRNVPSLTTTIGQVDTKSKLRSTVHGVLEVRDILQESYGLNVYADHRETIFVSRDRNGHQVSISLTGLKEAEWKKKALESGDLQAPEMHVILKIDRIMGKAAELYEADAFNKKTIAELEKENADLQSQVLSLQLVKEDLDAAAGIGGRLRKRKKIAE